jgi:hypothetical protein
VNKERKPMLLAIWNKVVEILFWSQKIEKDVLENQRLLHEILDLLRPSPAVSVTLTQGEITEQPKE